MPALQHLDLINRALPVGSLRQLSQVTSLTGLRLHGSELHADNRCRQRLSSRDPSCAEAMAMLLANLPNLSMLHVTTLDSTNSDAGLRQISSMQHLQQLSVCDCDRAPGVFGLMPSSLTAVHLQGPAKFTTAAADQLSELLDLQLGSVTVDPSLLNSFPALQQLVLREVQYQPAALRSNARLTEQQHAQSMHQLLAAVGQMASLQHLELDNMPSLHDFCLPSSDSGRFTALTASSQLSYLHAAAKKRQVLPAQAQQYMLPAGACMQRLHALKLIGAGSVRPSRWDTSPHADIQGAACVDAADINRIAECCPALRELCLHNALHDAAAASSLAQLTRLTALTWLDIVGLGCRDTAAAAAVAQLTGLRDLRFNRSRSIGAQGQVTVAGLQQLTALSSLTNLRLAGWRYCYYGASSIYICASRRQRRRR